uniref:sigma-54-dependent transcriptional regulator n=1 Tax=Prevotella sp. TaxID=59823 RepID=UPI004026A5DC
MPIILIIEDDLTFGLMIQKWLNRKGFVANKASSLREARQQLEKMTPDLILSDLRLPDGDGISLLSQLRDEGLSTPFIVMTSYAEVENAVLAMKAGATDYIAKPFPPDLLLEKISEALRSSKLSAVDEVAGATPQGQEPSAPDKATVHDAEASTPIYIEGESEASKQLYRYVDLVAPTPMSVLILGASGTGKEYVARRIHAKSPRHDKPFFALDCGAIPREVAASEFFGYRKGAFTGADCDKQGAFEAANGGTLFLDEMGNLPYEIQVQLLRALQQRVVRPLGSTEEIPIDIRLVCATNEDLAQRVRDGQFREDLYHRINEFTISMPELKDRGSDLFLFANLFMRQADEELGRHVSGFTQAAQSLLASYPWPGNLRELNNVVKRATLLAQGELIGTDELRLTMNPEVPASTTAPLHDDATERQLIVDALRAARGNKSKAARLLEVDRKTLYNKLKKYGLE